MTEGLKKLGTQIAQHMFVPDADIEFLTNMQLLLRKRALQSAQDAAAGIGGGAEGQAGIAGGMPGAGGGMGSPNGGPGPVLPGGAVPGLGLGPPPPQQMAPGGMAGGGMGGIGTPNADELRRVLSASAGL